MEDMVVVGVDENDFGLNGHELGENGSGLFRDELGNVDWET